MTFKEAIQEVKALANGRYYSLRYEFSDFNHLYRKTTAECSVYIDKYTYYVGPTWREAIDILKSKMEKNENQEEMPDEENSIAEAV